MRRRDFVRAGLMAAAGSSLTSLLQFARAEETATTALSTVPLVQRICLFTDHLDDHGYSYADVAKMIRPLKLAGPDLTVRAGGLVPPDRVGEELPKAVAAFRDQGLSVPMLTTNLTSVRDSTATPILAAMGKLGIHFYKLGYYHYHDLPNWETELTAHRKDLEGLLALGRQFHVQAGLHNHAGATIGGAVWDGWEFLKPLDPAGVGFFFDPSHATIEGGNHGWKLNFQRISPRLTMVALKDFVWEKTASGWRTRWVPLGQGAVNWSEFFSMLGRFTFHGPISLHIEYDPGGSTRLERIDNSLAAAERDLNFVRKHLEQPVNTK